MQRRIIRRVSPSADSLPTDLHPVLRRVYLNRGVSSAAELDLRLASLLPFTALKGIDRAIELLETALRKAWHICIIGDYDADGATSTALMVSVLRELGAAHVSYLVPDRFRFGYGLTPEIVALALERKPDLLITVDNGIASIDGVAAARAAGTHVLITDHHLAARILPDADAIVNPNQPGCAFPSKCLAGVGVAFYVLAALRARLRDSGWFASHVEPKMAAHLDLVALGSVADVVPLDYNNRILVSQGIANIRAGRCRPGVRALLDVAGRDAARLSAADLGFAVGPRLNAAGRLEDMSIGIECLLADEEASARELAQRLDALNRERREIQQQMQEEALLATEVLAKQVGTAGLPMALCLFDENWHQGVVGLVASRIKERYHRPVIAFSPAEEAGVLKGSARSVHGFHIRDALDSIATRHPGLISKFGGHAMAAGLSLPLTHLHEFRAAFEAEAARLLAADQVDGAIETDGELTVDTVTLELAEALRSGGPWGQGFQEPLFDGRFEILESRVVGEKHLRLRMRHEGGGVPLPGIAFNQVDEHAPGTSVQAAYRLDVNEWQGMRSCQLAIEYMAAV